MSPMTRPCQLFSALREASPLSVGVTKLLPTPMNARSDASSAARVPLSGKKNHSDGEQGDTAEGERSFRSGV